MKSTKQPKKGACEATFPYFIAYPFNFYRFTHALFSETPILFAKKYPSSSYRRYQPYSKTQKRGDHQPLR